VGMSMAVPAIFDVIVFKDGNLANGKILTHTFPIKTNYGEIVVKKKGYRQYPYAQDSI
jgi:hypothetical protein